MRFLHVILLLLLATTSGSAAQTVVRCAFDIGSGETKVSAARVTMDGEKVSVKKLFSKKTEVLTRKAVQDGVMPDSMIGELAAKLAAYKKECESVGATQFAGVATSGFRLAKKNGQEALNKVGEKVGASLKVITGDQEARIGYLSAESEFSDQQGPIVVWDVGGGSIQFATKKDGREILEMLGVGAASFHDMLLKEFKREKGLNPMSAPEMKAAVGIATENVAQVNDDLRKILTTKGVRVVGIGGVHNQSVSAQAGLKKSKGKSYYAYADVLKARASAVGKSDEWFKKRFANDKYPENQASNLALVSGMMEGLKIKQVYPLDVNLTDGLFKDQSAWTK